MGDPQRDYVLLIKPAVLQTRSKEKLAGKLTVSKLALKWEPEVLSVAQPVRLEVKFITGQQKTKEKPMLRLTTKSTNFIFQFSNLPDRDNVIDILSSLLQSKDGQGPKAGSSKRDANQSKHGESSGHGMTAKRQILDADSDTRELYEALVLGGTISESDFWRARSQWHNTDKQAPKQRVGWATALMADVTPKDDGTKKVRLNLSAQTIQQIFAERPWVHKSYSELVPHIMDDKEFWTRFCKHEFAFEAKLQKMAEGKQREAFEIDDEYADLFSEPAQAAEEQHTARVKARCVDPTVNLVANDDDNFGEGYGVLHNARRAHEAAAPGVSHDIIRGINRHGTVILEGVPEEPTEDAATAARRMAMERRSELQKFAQVGLAEIDDESFQQIEQRERHALEDLKSAQTGNFVGLNIRGLHDFLHGRVEEPQTSTPAVGGSGLRGQNRPATSALEALDRLDGSCLVSMPPLGKPASQVLINMFHGRSGRSDDPGSAEMEPGSKAVDVVSPEDQRLLRNRALITNELLRHFWASFPASSPARKAKAAKLKSELWNMHKSLLELREDCNGPARPYILQILKPLLSALEAAFEKYDRDAVHR